MAASAASKSMWCSAVFAQAKSKLARPRVSQVIRFHERHAAGRLPLRAVPARAIIRASRSIAVTSAQRSASLQASIPSPQPTSSAAAQSAGTARRMTGW